MKIDLDILVAQLFKAAAHYGMATFSAAHGSPERPIDSTAARTLKAIADAVEMAAVEDNHHHE